MYPVALRLGSLVVHTYPLVLLAGVAAATLIARAHAARARVPLWAVNDLALAAVVGGFGGARLWHAATFPAAYAPRWWRMFVPNAGGLVFYGGVAGILVAAVAVAWIEHLPMPAVADLVALALPAACAIGRLGCLAAGCCGGAGVHLGGFGVPPQLVDATAQLVLLAVLLAIAARVGVGRGTVALAWLTLYPALRFAIEYLRDEPRLLLGMTQAQIVSVPLAIAGGVLLWTSTARGGVRWTRSAC